MKVVIAQDRGELGRYVAQQAAEVLRGVLSEKDECNLVVATGSSQFETLDNLVRETDIDWSRVNGFHLDEYLGIERKHSASFCGYLASRFVDKVSLKSFFFMDGMRPPAELQAAANAAVADKSIDLLLCGIGENGHLAFNDPPADFKATDPYLIVELDEPCRRQQVGEGWFDSFEQVPNHAISMSVQQILQAKQVLCCVPDNRKAAAVRATLESEVSPLVPASILQQHGNTTLALDSASASLLSESTMASAEQLG